MRSAPLACLLVALGAQGAPDPETELRRALANPKGLVELPAGTILLHRPLEVRGSLEIRGHARGSTLAMAPDFQGRAAILGVGVSGLRLAGFEIRGNRAGLRSPRYLPASNVSFAGFYADNGILIERGQGVEIQGVTLRNLRGFAILISASSDVAIHSVTVENCGSLNSRGRNNTTGGILLEEGASHFSVCRSVIRNVTGNGIWTHSNYGSPRNRDGVIAGNTIDGSARSAIQVGHATRVRVEQNSGTRIGYPAEYVDLEGQANPVALDTAGNVDHTVYTRNHFTEINGHCIDLDGFHDGEVSHNSCVNRGPDSAYPYLHFGIFFGNHNPDMTSSGVVVSGNLVEGFAFGGLFLIGSGHRIENNRFLDLNRHHCTGDATRPGCNYAPEQPGLLRSGIYLADNGGRPAETRDNIIRGNEIKGFGMDRWCIGAAPGVELARNSIAENRCAHSGR